MANPEHLKILKPGVKVWDAWRQDHPEEQPDLSGADLRNANFLGADFQLADLSGGKLSPTHLWKAVEGLTVFTGQISGGTVTGEREKEREKTQPIDFSGEPRATRTLGPRLKRAMLYQLS